MATNKQPNRSKPLQLLTIVSLAAVLIFAIGVHSFHAEEKPVSKAKGDLALGQYLSSTCVSCHLLSGKQKAGVPAIVGWPSNQFIVVMDSYKKKERDNKVMQTIAAGLSAEDIASLALYFGSLKVQKP